MKSVILVSLLLASSTIFAQSKTRKVVDTFLCDFEYKEHIIAPNGQITQRNINWHKVLGWQIVYTDTVIYKLAGFKPVPSSHFANPSRIISIKFSEDNVIIKK